MHPADQKFSYLFMSKHEKIPKPVSKAIRMGLPCRTKRYSEFYGIELLKWGVSVLAIAFQGQKGGIKNFASILCETMGTSSIFLF